MFPKDFEIEKELLISLWMAQKFIVLSDAGQSVEDAAEVYFSILLRRCFFQDINHDEFHEIYSCKIHNLMHDMAQKVAGKEICITNFVVNMDEKVRYLALVRNKSTKKSFTKSHITGNSYFKLQQPSVEALVANWVCLRVLDLRFTGTKSLPDSIGKLLHCF